MDERPASATAALDIMRGWAWMSGDPDGNTWPVWTELSEATNRLAMEGIADPQAAILALMCRGDLLAMGDYRWRKYQGGNHYQLERTDSPIKVRQWEVLAKLIEAENQEMRAGGFCLPQIDLQNLGEREASPLDYKFLDNRFATAHCQRYASHPEWNELEESFSAWNISVLPARLDDELQPEPPEPSQPETRKGGRPPAADWEVAALEIAGRYYRGDFKPQTIADVGRELAAWLGNQDLHPSDSVVRIHAKRIFDAFQAWEQG